MKIPLHLPGDGPAEGNRQDRAMEMDILECKKGDWEAKARLIREFMPLLTTLAKKRGTDTATINRLVEAGKDGLVLAARKYRVGSPQKFQIFAVPFIEKAMEHALSGGGFFARLLGR